MNNGEYLQLKEIIKQVFKGGEGSGNFGHAGRPGEVGGSAATGGAGIGTATWEGLAQPSETAQDILNRTELKEITEGSEKQIKYAKDLRDNFISSISGREYQANVRWAVIKQTGRNEKLDHSDIWRLANDAWNRRIVNYLNTNNAKTVIDIFKSSDWNIKQSNAITRYSDVIENPDKWNFNGSSWQKK